ncbi:MAG: hypothetical protein OXN83_01405, partial [Oligoflexia bacterium]|nr:hypothetical protein [Oligoflexia bacterium]
MFFWLFLLSFSSFGLDCKKPFEKQNKRPSALVIGAGAFGLSFSQALSSQFEEVFVLGRDTDHIYKIREHKNSYKLPQAILSDNIVPHVNWKPLLDKKIDVLVWALPFEPTNHFVKTHRAHLSQIIKNNKDVNIISLSKGLAVSPE